MKSKILSLFLLTAILSIAMVSAATNFTVTQPTALSKSNNETSFIVTAVSGIILTIPTFEDFIDSSNNVIELTQSSTIQTLTTGEKETTITITHSLSDSQKADLDFETLLESITITEDTSSDVETINLNFLGNFCELGEQGDEHEDIGLLEIVDVEIDNNDGDDLDWSPLDTITIEIEVENIGDDKVRDVMVEIGLFDASGKNIIDDMKELDSEEVELGSINDGDDDTAIFEFQVPADFEDDTYNLVIKAYSDDMNEDTVCTSKVEDFAESDYYESINGERESDDENHIVVDSIRLSPTDPQCGEIVQVSAEVFNIGDYDYEDQVKVTIVNEALGIDETITIREDFDQGDSEEIDFEFTIPENAEPKVYLLEFRTYYDYDDKDDYYDIGSEKRFIKSLTLEGNCIVIPESSVDITAQLDDATPEANAGEQVIIKTTLENTGEDATLYTVTVYGNSAWSSLENIDPATIIVPAGESKDVSIILNIDNDVQGDKEFTIKATYDGETTEQKVALSVTAKTSGITGAAISDHIKTNGFIYAIVLINLILIIAIILVIRRMVGVKVPAGM